MTVIGKSITKEYFGQGPAFSYFSGCSGGGRQAMMLAQRYPDSYDGLLSMAPAINYENFIPAGFWAQQVMKDLGVVPTPCEIKAFTKAAIDACDELDGVKDGIISAPDLCHFNPHSVVGQRIACNGTGPENLTKQGAHIVEAAWNGPRNPSGNIGWFGLNKDASLTSTYIPTKCSSNGTCVVTSSELLGGFIKYFIAKDPHFDTSNMTDEEFLTGLQTSDREYHSILGTTNPDLRRFRDAGGKLLSWHGVADEVIPLNGTTAYYQQVLKLDPTAHDYYRFFEAPGVAHCQPASGAFPRTALDHLIAWVEKGIVPDTLNATLPDGTMRPLCPYPMQQAYVGGSPKNTSSFSCVSTPTANTSLLADMFPFYQPS
jgi:pimeloyl-ACP methyl ester carboxylesterase